MSDVRKANDTVKKKKKSRKKKEKTLFGKIVSGIFCALLIFMLIGVLTAGVVALKVCKDIGLIGSHDISEDIPGKDYIDLDAYIAAQEKTSIIYGFDEDGNEVELARLHGSENRIWIDIDDCCDYLKNAVVALEDKRFYSHDGVDWIRTIACVVEYYGQGGSTLTQQLIKNLTGENSRTLVRKYNEIKNALALERHYNKNDILEAYLNTIYLDMGCYGVKTGAEYYFNKTPAELTLMESCILASITNAPRKYNPILNYETNRERALMTLGYMLEQGFITQDEYDEAVAEDVKFYGVMLEDGEGEDDGTGENAEEEYYSFYVDFVIDTVIEDLQKKYGYSKSEAFSKVYYGGLTIYAAEDARVQSIMEDVYENRTTFPYEADTPENPAIQSAMTVMDYDGRVCGIVGRLGKKGGNRMLNMAADSPRQPGSSIKPLSAYAPAIDTGYFYWSSYLPNYGITLSDGSVWPTNYGGSRGSINEMLNLPQAIAPSYNTVPARLVEALSTDVCYKYLRDRFHISTLSESDNAYAPLAIGAMSYGVTTLDLTAAYVTFGNGGVYYEPWCYYKVLDSTGKIILEPNRVGEQAISEGTASVMNHLLQVVVTNGTGVGFGVNGFTTFAKSGTTSDMKDKWFVGGTPHYVAAVWVGYEKPKEININYFSSSPGGKVFREVMNRIHSGLESKNFEYSEDCIQRSFCTYTGCLASSSCRSTSTGYFRADALPKVCTACSGGRSGSPGGDEGVETY